MIKVNDYFDGKVKSFSINTSQGPATVGVMESGEYEFGTASVEVMQVVTGVINAKLPGKDWVAYSAGQTFQVDANVKFLVKMDADASYVCYYQ